MLTKRKTKSEKLKTIAQNLKFKSFKFCIMVLHFALYALYLSEASRSARCERRGRRVFASAVKAKGRPMLERCEVRMLAQVTAMKVKTLHAERPRFPWQCQSAKG